MNEKIAIGAVVLTALAVSIGAIIIAVANTPEGTAKETREMREAAIEETISKEVAAMSQWDRNIFVACVGARLGGRYGATPTVADARRRCAKVMGLL